MLETLKMDDVIESVCKYYGSLSPVSKEALKAKSEIHFYEKGTMIVREGQYSEKLFYIVSGCARAFYLKEGKDITDWFAFENQFISAINSFFQGIPSPHYLEVLEDTVFLEISRENIEYLSSKFLDINTLGRMAVTRTMLELQQRIVALQFETAQQKYENLFKIYPDITQRVPLMHIASYLGITLETLSRIRHPKRRI